MSATCFVRASKPSYQGDQALMTTSLSLSPFPARRETCYLLLTAAVVLFSLCALCAV